MGVTTLPESLSPAKRRNGHRAGQVVPLLGPQIDHLLELRALIRRAQAEERVMTAEIIAGLEATGVTRLAGHQAVAILDAWLTRLVDPGRLYGLVGELGFDAMTVNITAGRRLLGEDALNGISQTTTSPVLRVEPARPAA
jgi:hypothetical protein